jgi:glycosyltransferase involved in cell wall biosynthesis
MTKVSIIAIHHDACPEERFQAFLQSLRDQTSRDFECILIYDGPLGHEPPKEWFEGTNLVFMESKTKTGGNANRPEAMAIAKGEWILQTGSDNLYYPEAVMRVTTHGVNCDALVFTVKMVGLESDGERIWYSSPRNYNTSTILKGIPVKVGNIDLMQMACKKEIYNKIGGWFDYTIMCDGVVFEKIASVTEVKHVPQLIGEHW